MNAYTLYLYPKFILTISAALPTTALHFSLTRIPFPISFYLYTQFPTLLVNFTVYGMNYEFRTTCSFSRQKFCTFLFRVILQISKFGWCYTYECWEHTIF